MDMSLFRPHKMNDKYNMSPFFMKSPQLKLKFTLGIPSSLKLILS